MINKILSLFKKQNTVLPLEPQYKSICPSLLKKGDIFVTQNDSHGVVVGVSKMRGRRYRALSFGKRINIHYVVDKNSSYSYMSTYNLQYKPLVKVLEKSV